MEHFHCFTLLELVFSECIFLNPLKTCIWGQQLFFFFPQNETKAPFFREETWAYQCPIQESSGNVLVIFHYPLRHLTSAHENTDV